MGSEETDLSLWNLTFETARLPVVVWPAHLANTKECHTSVVRSQPQLHCVSFHELAVLCIYLLHGLPHCQYLGLRILEWYNGWRIMNWKRCGRTRLRNLKHCLGIHLETPRKVTKTKISRASHQDLNLGYSEYETRLLTNRPTSTFGKIMKQKAILWGHRVIKLYFWHQPVYIMHCAATFFFLPLLTDSRLCASMCPVNCWLRGAYEFCRWYEFRSRRIDVNCFAG
jgi:hypothetical protein